RKRFRTSILLWTGPNRTARSRVSSSVVSRLLTAMCGYLPELAGLQLQDRGRLLVGQSERTTGTHLDHSLVGEEPDAGVGSRQAVLLAGQGSDGQVLAVRDEQQRSTLGVLLRHGGGLRTEAPHDRVVEEAVRRAGVALLALNEDRGAVVVLDLTQLGAE